MVSLVNGIVNVDISLPNATPGVKEAFIQATSLDNPSTPPKFFPIELTLRDTEANQLLQLYRMGDGQCKLVDDS